MELLTFPTSQSKKDLKVIMLENILIFTLNLLFSYLKYIFFSHTFLLFDHANTDWFYKYYKKQKKDIVANSPKH